MTIPATTSRRSATERGYSLAEILVVMLIFSAIIIAALMIYDRSNKVFKQSVEASDMQQSTRVAFDRLVADIRLAGFDYDRDGIPFGSLASPWVGSTSYVLGNLVQPNPPNGHVYICISGGTSGASAPSWPTAKNSTVNDGAAKWQENGDVQYQQPDEQIEYAGDKAITLRANFNFETATAACPTAGSCKTCENGREQCLESVQFPLVTTNNQEIVTYALVSNSGNANANKDTIEFFADTDIPRDINPKSGKKETKVDITGVDLTNNYPPYTLYRYALKDDGTPDAGVPIADNIRSMTLQYYTDTAASTIPDATGKTHEIGCGDANQCEVAALPLGNGQFDGANPDTDIPERDTRAKIKSVRLKLVGMNPQIDAAFTDTADTVAPHYRKLELNTVIVPRNLGKHGMKEFNTTLPESPSLKSVCIGACEAVYLTWAAPSTGGDIDSYNIVYNQGACSDPQPLTYAVAEDAGKNLSGYASKAVPGTAYRFAVQSINKYGSATSNCIDGTPINKTTPSTPSNLSASGGADPTFPAQANKVQLKWTPTTTNTDAASTMSCTDGQTQSAKTIPFAEKTFYRVYRALTQSFTPGANGTTKIIDEKSTNQPSVSGSNLTVVDPTAANCLAYYYKIEAVNFCVTNSNWNNPPQSTLAESGYIPGGNAVLGMGTTSQTPAAPQGLAVNSLTCNGNSNNCDVTFTWQAVAKDTTGAPMNIGQYKLYVTDLSTNTQIGGSPFTTTSQTYTVNNLGQGNISGYKIEVSALDCNEGAKGASIIWPCIWDGGTITTTPNAFYGGTGVTNDPWIMQTPDTLSVTTQNPIKKIEWTVSQNNVVIGQGSDAGLLPKSSFTVSVPDLDEEKTALVHVTFTSASGTCAITENYFILDHKAPACALTDNQTDPLVVQPGSGANGKNLNIKLKNSSTDVLKPKKIIVKWNTGYASNASLNSITYPKSGGGTASITSNCSTSTVMFDISSNADSIAASQTNYAVTLVFSHNTGINTTMLNGSICVVYQSPFGDILSCQIFPNANSCTNLSGSTCQ